MTVYEMRMRQRARKVKRAKRSISVISIVIVVILIALLLCGSSSVQCAAEYEYKSTDTLWDLLKYCPEDIDRWDFIYEIMELNGMEDMTVSTDRLYMVPIYK